MMATSVALLGGVAPALAQDAADGPDAPEALDMDAVAALLEQTTSEQASSELEEQALEQEAEQLREQAEAAQHRLVVAARAVQDAEALLTELEARLVRIDAELATAQAQLVEDRARLSGATLALYQVAAASPLALLANGEDPNRAVRAGVVLSTLAPALSAEVAAMAERTANLTELRRETEDQRAKVARASARLDAERATLAGIHTELDDMHRARYSALAAAHDRSESLAEHVDALAGLMDDLRLARVDAPTVTVEFGAAAPVVLAAIETDLSPYLADGASMAAASGQLRLPATGDVSLDFDVVDAFGLVGRGLHIAARPGAQLVSPHGGVVAYAAPFPGRGLVLIIDHGEGYHTVISGLSRIDTAVGRRLLSGEPIGIAADAPTPGTAGVVSIGVELRHDGVPINPKDWFLLDKDGMDE